MVTNSAAAGARRIDPRVVDDADFDLVEWALRSMARISGALTSR